MSLTQVRLSWKDKSSDETGFQIYRSTTGAGGPYVSFRTVSQNVTRFTDSPLSPGRIYCYYVRAIASSQSAISNRVCATTLSGTTPAVRIVTFGDSNTDWGVQGTNPEVIARSYISAGTNAAAMHPNSPHQLAGKVERRWRVVRTNAIKAVNHAISGTTTGGGNYGGPNRRSDGSPQARTLVGNITRYEGEVLGLRWPWSGGEPVNTKYVEGSLRRVQSFTLGAHDFVYVSMGTNDPANRISTSQTLSNLRWMIETWTGAGRRADHFLLTTLAPRSDKSGGPIPSLNDGIRSVAAATGVVLIDLARYTSGDNGRTWRSGSLHVGDGVHYSESVRDWLAAQVVSAMSSRVP